MLPQSLDIGAAIEELLLIWAAMEPHELQNQIRHYSRDMMVRANVPYR